MCDQIKRKIGMLLADSQRELESLIANQQERGNDVSQLNKSLLNLLDSYCMFLQWNLSELEAKYV